MFAGTPFCNLSVDCFRQLSPRAFVNARFLRNFANAGLLVEFLSNKPPRRQDRQERGFNIMGSRG